ncbi:hypothetical protein HanPI659440_Chr02g0039861 [Helianthus annuus]|nr:hypothetical protein HanPI659440_Chr02g0039861 [Helianthus annuus]
MNDVVYFDEAMTCFLDVNCQQMITTHSYTDQVVCYTMIEGVDFGPGKIDSEHEYIYTF